MFCQISLSSSLMNFQTDLLAFRSFLVIKKTSSLVWLLIETNQIKNTSEKQSGNLNMDSIKNIMKLLLILLSIIKLLLFQVPKHSRYMQKCSEIKKKQLCDTWDLIYNTADKLLIITEFGEWVYGYFYYSFVYI